MLTICRILTMKSFIKLFLLLQCICQFSPVFAISDAQLGQEIRSALNQGRYGDFEKLLKNNEVLNMTALFPGGEKDGSNLFHFFEAVVNQTRWQTNGNLIIYADRAMRPLLALKLSSKLQKKFQLLQSKVELAVNSNTVLARGLDLEGTAEAITLPKGLIFPSAPDKNKQIHVYKAALKKW
ncbi:MAG TPA: hypothetical protein VN457_06530, partial [Chlamydiales bacterium]|nr:hypothetical protein [Chlamydiales bacterium]